MVVVVGDSSSPCPHHTSSCTNSILLDINYLLFTTNNYIHNYVLSMPTFNHERDSNRMNMCTYLQNSPLKSLGTKSLVDFNESKIRSGCYSKCLSHSHDFPCFEQQRIFQTGGNYPRTLPKLASIYGWLLQPKQFHIFLKKIGNFTEI